MFLKKDSVNATQVQSTNDASIVSKCSMAHKNYIKDDFVKYFVQKVKPRTSLIHLGYYTRAVIFSELLIKFVQFLHQQKILKFQIISCGAGFDSTYWRLSQDGLLDENSIFVEIDYANVINKKMSFIEESGKLKSMLKISKTEDERKKKLNSNYFLLCADLCDLETIEMLLKEIDIDFNVPTLFLSECVITYMREKFSNGLVKWMTEKFRNCAFINYEQIHPEDGFGEVMLRHFNKLQSSLNSIITYPDCNSHRERYQLLGFEKSIVLSEWNFLMLLTNTEERKRVLNLEQFDEFEEFHLKCVHYVVAVAANNILSQWARSIMTDEPLSPHGCQGSQRNFYLERTGNNLEVMGHTTCELKNKTFLIFGGFSPRGRSKEVYQFHNQKIEKIHVSTGAKNPRLDAIHGTAISFESNGRIYVGLYGGRTSPDTICNGGEFVLMEYSGKELEAKTIRSADGAPGPAPRYRHSAICRMSDANEISVWIFGGRTDDLNVNLRDFWKLEIDRNSNGSLAYRWISKEPKTMSPSGRMSHSAAISSAGDAMYISCGLDSRSFAVRNDIWKWTFDSETWEKVDIENGALIPRYGHTSHVLKNTLYLLGGVNTYAGCQPGLALINLDTCHVVEYAIETCSVEPVLLFNHSSIVVEDEDRGNSIIVLGGGGNCFSFGTHFNKNAHAVRLGQFDA